MKKLVLSLLGAATMAISSSAMALNTNLVYWASIDRGVLMDPVGSLFFEFSADEGIMHGCQYVAEWDSAAMLPFSGQCWLLEAKTQGNFSCVDNSWRPVPSFITIDNSTWAGAAPTGGLSPSFCSGFDQFQQLREVAFLMLAENVVDGSLTGIVAFTPAAPVVYGIQLIGH